MKKIVLKGIKLFHQWQEIKKAQSNTGSTFCKGNNEWNTGWNNSDVLTILNSLFNSLGNSISKLDIMYCINVK